MCCKILFHCGVKLEKQRDFFRGHPISRDLIGFENGFDFINAKSISLQSAKEISGGFQIKVAFMPCRMERSNMYLVNSPNDQHINDILIGLS